MQLAFIGTDNRPDIRGGCKRGALALIFALACVVGTVSAAETWTRLATLNDGGIVELETSNVRPQRHLGLSDYVASQMPTHWASIVRYTWPTDRVQDGVSIRSVRVKLLWICESPMKVAQWGLWAFDSKGNEVIDKGMDFEMDDLPSFRQVAGDDEQIGKRVCSVARK